MILTPSPRERDSATAYREYSTAVFPPEAAVFQVLQLARVTLYMLCLQG